MRKYWSRAASLLALEEPLSLLRHSSSVAKCKKIELVGEFGGE